MKEFITILIIAIVFILILYYFVSRPTKTVKITDTMFIADVRMLPNGLYTLIVEEISPRMAAYSYTTSVGEFDKIFHLHHSQLPFNKDSKKFQDTFLIEEGKIIA